MTCDEILKLEANPETDALVAEKVMGWTDLGSGWDTGGEENGFKAWTPEGELLPVVWISKSQWQPTIDISAAWVVVEKMREIRPDLWWNIEDFEHANKGRFWWICLWDGHDFSEASEDTSFPMAICRAALLAVMNDAPNS